MNRKYRIEWSTGLWMLAGTGVAFVARLLLTFTVILEPMSEFVSFAEIPSLFLWFAILGVKMISKDSNTKLLSMMGVSVADLIPVLNALPGSTAGVLVTILKDRAEQRKEWEEEDKKAAAQKPGMPRISMRTAAQPAPAANDAPSAEEARVAA